MTLTVDGYAIAGPTNGNPFTISYFPAAPLNGVLVLVADTNTTLNPGMDGVLLNGVAMTQIDQSPFFHTAGDDDGQLMGWFTGSGLPNDTSEIEFTFQMDDTSSGVSVVRVFGIVSSTDSDTGIAGTGTSSTASETNPTYEMGPSTYPVLPFGLLLSGHDAVGSVASGAEWDDTETDTGTRIASWVTPLSWEELPASESTIVMDWIAAPEDAGWFGVMVYQVVPDPVAAVGSAHLEDDYYDQLGPMP